MHVVADAHPTVAMYSDGAGEGMADHELPPLDDRSTTAWLNENGEYCPASEPTARHVAPLHPVTETSARPLGSVPSVDDIVVGSSTPTPATANGAVNVTHECGEVHDAAVIPPSCDHVAPPFVVTQLFVLPTTRHVAGAVHVTPVYMPASDTSVLHDEPPLVVAVTKPSPAPTQNAALAQSIPRAYVPATEPVIQVAPPSWVTATIICW
jgi:hypothetical protein